MIAAGLLVLGLGLPAGAGGAAPPPAPSDLVFPPPPDAPRVRYLSSLAGPQDLAAHEPDWVMRTWNLLLGRKSVRGNSLARPYGVAADATRVYVADSDGASVVVFDLARHEVLHFGGSADGRLVSAIGVAVVEGGTVFVTDSAQNVIKVFARDGTFLASYHVLAGLKRPTGLCYDAPRKRLIVADTGNSRVLVCDLQGKLLREIGGKGTGPGRMAVPVNVAVDGTGRIYVVDPLACRVQAYGPDGAFEREFGERGDIAGEFARPRGIAVDSDGNLHVTDAAFNVVQVFSPDGKLLVYYGRGGHGPASFDLPAGIFIDPQDRVYVADSMNHRVETFQYLKVVTPVR